LGDARQGIEESEVKGILRIPAASRKRPLQGRPAKPDEPPQDRDAASVGGKAVFSR